MAKTRKGTYKRVNIITKNDGSMTIDLPEIMDERDLIDKLPNVSIVTITYNRALFAGIMLYNWMQLKYPREKLEWLIIDDSDEKDYDLNDFLPQEDPYITYMKLDKKHSISDKRNMGADLAKYDYIVHMDDDDYYFPDHVLAKIRIMEYYKCDGVHSMPIGVYDLVKDNSFVIDPVNKDGLDSNNVAEATLAYKKEYWLNNKFAPDNENGTNEGKAFIGKHFKKWANVNFFFNMISITHNKNVTSQARRLVGIDTNSIRNSGDFKDVFPEDFKTALNNVRKLLM